MSGAEISTLPKEFSEKLLTCKGNRTMPYTNKGVLDNIRDAFIFCTIRRSGGCRACTGGHPSGNGRQVAMPPDEGGIVMIGQGKESSPIRSEKMPEAGKVWQKEK